MTNLIVGTNKATYHRGRLTYKVRYNNDGKSSTIWQYADKLPEEARKEFHSKYSFSGKVRKRPQIVKD